MDGRNRRRVITEPAAVHRIARVLGRFSHEFAQQMAIFDHSMRHVALRADGTPPRAPHAALVALGRQRHLIGSMLGQIESIVTPDPARPHALRFVALTESVNVAVHNCLVAKTAKARKERGRAIAAHMKELAQVRDELRRDFKRAGIDTG